MAYLFFHFFFPSKKLIRVFIKSFTSSMFMCSWVPNPETGNESFQYPNRPEFIPRLNCDHFPLGPNPENNDKPLKNFSVEDKASVDYSLG